MRWGKFACDDSACFCLRIIFGDLQTICCYANCSGTYQHDVMVAIRGPTNRMLLCNFFGDLPTICCYANSSGTYQPYAAMQIFLFPPTHTPHTHTHTPHTHKHTHAHTGTHTPDTHAHTATHKSFAASPASHKALFRKPLFLRAQITRAANIH